MAYCLIVDDDPTVAELLALLLAQGGHRSTIAFTAAEAERVAASEPPDLLFVDRNLPDLSGVELVARLKLSLPRVPMVMVSGSTGPEEVAESLAAGASELLAKPFESIELILALVERTVRA